MPWMAPRSTLRFTSLLAWTSPKRLLMAMSSMAGDTGFLATSPLARRSEDRGSFRKAKMTGIPDAALGRPGCRVSLDRALRIRHVVVHLDSARLDVGGGLVGGCLHLGRYECLVVLVHGISDSILGEAEHGRTGLPGPVLGLFEGRVGRVVDALEHRSQDLAGMQAVLVRIDADAEFPGIRGGPHHADAGATG